jgi:hypothetical protein
MFRVIDSLLFNQRALQNVPDFLEKLGPGLLVTINAEQKPSFLIEPGSTVRVHRPNGTVIDQIVTGIEIWGPHVGLFFSKGEQHEIPTSSEIELPA